MPLTNHPTTFPCPIDDCSELRTWHQVMCLRHWRLVPKPLARSIWRLYSQHPRSVEHLVAIGEAITIVNDLAVNA